MPRAHVIWPGQPGAEGGQGQAGPPGGQAGPREGQAVGDTHLLWITVISGDPRASLGAAGPKALPPQPYAATWLTVSWGRRASRAVNCLV